MLPDTDSAYITMLGITLDIDWSPDCFIDETAAMLQEAGVAATWFVTHLSPAVERLRNNPRFELGIHPNFLPGSSHGTTSEEVLRCCMEMVPGATAMRTHALVQSTPLLVQVLRETPVRTDLSLFLDGASVLMPNRFWWGGNGECLLRLPFFWEDDFAMETPGWTGDSYDSRLIRSPGLRILNFHPVHIGLNSHTFGDYQRARSVHTHLREVPPDQLRTFTMPGPGVRTWLEALLMDIKTSGLTTGTVRELSAHWA